MMGESDFGSTGVLNSSMDAIIDNVLCGSTESVTLWEYRQSCCVGPRQVVDLTDRE